MKSFLFMPDVRLQYEMFDKISKDLGNQLLWATIVYGTEEKIIEGLDPLVAAALENNIAEIDNNEGRYQKAIESRVEFLEKMKEAEKSKGKKPNGY